MDCGIIGTMVNVNIVSCYTRISMIKSVIFEIFKNLVESGPKKEINLTMSFNR